MKKLLIKLNTPRNLLILCLLIVVADTPLMFWAIKKADAGYVYEPATLTALAVGIVLMAAFIRCLLHAGWMWLNEQEEQEKQRGLK